MSEEYNGWTNRETWVLNVWDYFPYETVKSVLEEQIIPDKLNDRDSLDTLNTIATNLLANWMQDYFNEYVGEMLSTDVVGESLGFLRDLIGANHINWRELAESHDELIGELVQQYVNRDPITK